MSTEKPTDEGETKPAKSEPGKGKSNMLHVLLKCYLTRHLKCYLRNNPQSFAGVSVKALQITKLLWPLWMTIKLESICA